MRISIRVFLISILLCLSHLTHATDLQNLGQKWSDTMITTKIKTQFTKNKNLNPLKISVTTKEGVVTLKGHAKNKTAFVDALRIVTNTHGVRSIDTTAFDIKLMNSAFADAYITAKIEAAILEAKVFDDESIPLVGINASTTNGIVTLTGTVKHKRSIVAMLKRAHRIHGVKKIRSYLTATEDSHE
ncbi:MAG: ornithine racemase [Legionella sp.]|nr:MAG: ornithine racemase [Legionella sp.]